MPVLRTPDPPQQTEKPHRYRWDFSVLLITSGSVGTFSAVVTPWRGGVGRAVGLRAGAADGVTTLPGAPVAPPVCRPRRTRSGPDSSRVVASSAAKIASGWRDARLPGRA